MTTIRFIIISIVIFIFNNLLVSQTMLWLPTQGPYGGIVKDIASDPINPDVIYCGLFYDGLYKTDNGGIDWYNLKVPEVSSVFSVLVHPKLSNISFISSIKGIHISTNEGQNWDNVLNNAIYCMVFNPLNYNTLFAGSREGRIYKSSDYGQNWKEFQTGSIFDVYTMAISLEDSNTIFAGIRGDPYYWGEGVYKSTDGGLTWINDSLPSGNVYSIIIDPLVSDHIFAGTDMGLYSSFDGGLNWKLTNDSLPNDGVGSLLFMKDKPNHLLASLFDGEVYETDTNKMIWNLLPIAGDFPIYVMRNSNNDASSLLVGGKLGLFRSNIDNSKFELIGAKRLGISSIAYHPLQPENVYSIGNALYKSNDGGNTWRLINSEIIGGKVLCMHPKDPNQLYAGNYYPGGSVYKTTNAGVTWNKTAIEDVAISDIAIPPNQNETLYCGGLEDPHVGGLFKSSNSGANWDTLSKKINISIVNKITPHPTDFNIVLVGTAHDGIFKTIDSGESWFQINSGLPVESGFVHEIQYDPLNANIIYTSIGNVGVFKSNNSGADWENIGLTDCYVRSIVIDPNNPDVLFAGSWGYGVFKSENGGYSWKEMNHGWDLPKCLSHLMFLSDNENTLIAASTQGVWKFNLATTNLDYEEKKNVTQFLLYQNYPNPFNSVTTIEFHIPEPSNVRLSIFNNIGEEISLVLSKSLNKGFHKYKWNANEMASGIYYYMLKTKKSSLVKKLIVLK